MREPIPRRRFLGYAGLGASAVALPSWLALGFEQDGEIPPLDLVLKEALARARTLGKPLLVFVVPTEPQRTWERQVLFGQFLNLAADDALADLALCEVACARMTDLAKLELGLAPEAEPLLVLVETDGARAQPQGLDPELPQGPAPFSRHVEDTGLERAVRGRVEGVAVTLHRALAPDRSTLERRARQAGDTLDEDGRRLAARLSEAPGAAAPEQIDRVAALVRAAAEQRPELRASALAALTRAARARLRISAPPGAWWAEKKPCGYELENGPQPEVGYACGMASVPALSRRFLLFYTSYPG